MPNGESPHPSAAADAAPVITRAITPAVLARHLAADLAPRLAGVPGWDERALVARVSPRPVGGVEVWRIPLAAALAAATGESAQRWVACVETSVARLGIEHARAGTAVDVPLRRDGLLPLTNDDMRLWHGPSGDIEVRTAAEHGHGEHGGHERHEGHEGHEGHVSRVSVFADAVMGLAKAAGDHAARRFEEEAGATEDAAGVVTVTSAATSRRIALGGVRVAGDRHEALWAAPGEPSTPVRAALLAARPGAGLVLETERLLARTSANPGFLLVHSALMAGMMAGLTASGCAQSEPDCPARTPVRDDGAESLIVGLASYPFVVEKGLATADPGLVLRHLLTVATRTVRLGAGGSEPPRHLWLSAAAVLAHGIEALGMRLPSRI